MAPCREQRSRRDQPIPPLDSILAMKFFNISFLIAIVVALIPATSHGFADWVVTNSPHPIPPNSSYKGIQHSHASGKGDVSVALVLDTPVGESLYFYSYNLYKKDSEKQSIVIRHVDTANEITSVQIQYDPINDNTHFAYSLKRDALPEEELTIPEVEVLRYAIYRSGYAAGTEFERTDIAKRTFLVGIPYEISLKIRPVPHSVTGTPAIAYRSAATGGSLSRLRYTERMNDGTWPISLIDEGPYLGKKCELAFSGTEHSAIVYQEDDGDLINIARRHEDGPWSTEIALLGLSSLVTDPTLTLNGSLAQIAYISHASPSYKINLRSEVRGGAVVHTTVRSETREIRDPKMVISNSRIVITSRVKNPRQANEFEPWVATKNSVASNFSSIRIAPPSQGGANEVLGDLNVAAGSISLDQLGYPIITWSEKPNGQPMACYCPDFTDIDNDGVPHLQEVALRMNPYVRDLHLYPRGEIFDGFEENEGERFFGITFPTAYSIDPIIDDFAPIVETTTFRYRVLASNDLKYWFDFNVGILPLENSPSQPTPGPYFRGYSLIPLGHPKDSLQLHLRIEIYRL